MAKRIDVEGLNAWFGSFQALADVSITVEPKQVTALIGPSGCGKSTFLRSLNRLHEVIPGARVGGQVLLDGQDIYDDGVDPVAVRRSIGMVFQRPNPFPTMSVRDNVVAGQEGIGRRAHAFADEGEQLHDLLVDLVQIPMEGNSCLVAHPLVLPLQLHQPNRPVM